MARNETLAKNEGNKRSGKFDGKILFPYTWTFVGPGRERDAPACSNLEADEVFGIAGMDLRRHLDFRSLR